jgi:hypothetical protein
MRRLLFLTLLGLFSGLLCGLGLFEVKAQSLSQRVTAATGEEEFTLNVINVSLSTVLPWPVAELPFTTLSNRCV